MASATVKLANGVTMPRLGLGTWRAPADVTKDAVISAVKDAGYRMIDTANDYGNENAVGEALKELFDTGVVKREEMFIQCKLWNSNMRKDLVKLDLLASLRDLQLSYVDSYIIHWPQCCPAIPDNPLPSLAWSTKGMDPSDVEKITTPGAHENNIHKHGSFETMFPIDDKGFYMQDPKVHYTETWEAMEALVDEGLCKTIGISNFNIAQVRDLLNSVKKHRPTVLQNEVHLYLQAKDMHDFCKSQGILLQAYSPLGSGQNPKAPIWTPPTTILENPVVKEIATKYGKSPAQIALKYTLQRGIALVTKSVNPGRIKENNSVWDFEMEAADMEKLAACNIGWRHLPWPECAGHPNFPFKEEIIGTIKAQQFPKEEWKEYEIPAMGA